VTVIPATRLVALLGEWRHGGPANERLAATLRALVLDGRIPIHSPLPAERMLAAALGVSRATVTAAYNQLRAEGYVTSRRGSGSWVTIPGGHRAAADAILPAGGLDMAIGALPAPAVLDELFRDSVRELPRWLDHHGYDPLGLPPLRSAIAERFTRRGLATRPEQILVTAGALQALDLTLRAIHRRGQAAMIEIPSYPAAIDALRAAGARLHAVPVSSDGWDIEALRSVARVQRPVIAYLIPDFQNPTGAVIDASARRTALHVLARAGTYAVIDETFVELHLDGPPLPPHAAALATGGRTITLGSLSKSVWGGLRVGWVRADPVIVQRLAAVRATIDMASPVFEQIVATHVLGQLDRIMDDRRELLKLRRDVLTASVDRHLPQWRYALPTGGLFIWATLPEPISTSLSVQARDRGLLITPGPRFGATGLLERNLRLPFALPPEQLEHAVSILASLSPSASLAAAPADPAYVA